MKSYDILLLLKLFSLHSYSQLKFENKISLSTLFDNELEETKYLLAQKYKNLLLEYSGKHISKYYNHHYNQKIAMKNNIYFSENDLIDLFSENKYSLIALEKSTGISKSQVSLSIKRCTNLKLLLIRDNIPYVNTQNLFKIILHSFAFFFPVKKIGNMPGMPISYSSPFLYEKILSSNQLPMVWPDPKGSLFGEAIEPLYKTVPYAAKKDPLLYEMLVLVDSIRLNNPREKTMAAEILHNIFTGKDNVSE